MMTKPSEYTDAERRAWHEHARGVLSRQQRRPKERARPALPENG